MDSRNKDLSPLLSQALARYDARFPLPVGFIDNTMLRVDRMAERRAYTRGLILISLVSLLMIATATVMFYIFSVKFSTTLPVLATVMHSFTTAESILTSPIVIHLAASSAILLSLDRIMRRRFATRHAA